MENEQAIPSITDGGPSVLVIASRFAPQTGPGATRLVKTVKYLRALGWRPVVLTTEAANHTDQNSDLPADITVKRVAAASTSEGLAAAEPLIRAAAAITRPLGCGACWWYRGLHWRAERWREKLSFPDPGIWRMTGALRAARRLQREYHFSAIFSSGMPFSDHLIGLAVQRELKLPWIVEFRDPWFEYAHSTQWRTPVGRTLTRRAEQVIVRRARFVVGVSPAMTHRLRERYPMEPAGKFLTILNGYDPCDFDRAALCEPPLPDMLDTNRFTVLHAGSFYAARSPASLIRGFQRFIGENKAANGHASLLFAGRLGPHSAVVYEASRVSPVHAVGALDYHTALACMTRATLNVLVLPGGDGTQGDLSTKVFEYLASGRPLLAATPRGAAAAQLLSNMDGVWHVEPNDEAGIARVLTEAYGLWKQRRLNVRRDPQQLQRFTRRHQTHRLVHALNAVRSATSVCMAETEASCV